MEVSSFTTVEFSSDNYVGGDFDDYMVPPRLALTNLRFISSLERVTSVEYVKGWGQPTATPIVVQDNPTQVNFLINANRADWQANQPFPQWFKSKDRKVARVTFKSSSSDPGAYIQFLCQPRNWSITPSTADALVVSCSVLVLSEFEPGFTLL